MNPLYIYVGFVAVLIAFSIGVRIFRHVATRKCHLCGAQVELGKGRCQVCNYRFVN
ncbi:MAG: hypothetical protein QOI10_2526 [Solirubrobacterales bacterium]|nr:hypothetical protein [Solirubrobacterales bacterium]